MSPNTKLSTALWFRHGYADERGGDKIHPDDGYIELFASAVSCKLWYLEGPKTADILRRAPDVELLAATHPGLLRPPGIFMPSAILNTCSHIAASYALIRPVW
ncbi:MAG: hypothetical protein EOO38_14430 [Cytophagaceae bacterium]|nr:MAG: hypothetical protein EOO38_14430 [Cytophagaceae bacterium]